MVSPARAGDGGDLSATQPSPLGIGGQRRSYPDLYALGAPPPYPCGCSGPGPDAVSASPELGALPLPLGGTQTGSRVRVVFSMSRNPLGEALERVEKRAGSPGPPLSLRT